MYSIQVESRFSSSHYLNEYQGDCARLHGHNWRVVVEVRGDHLTSNGMLIDFTILKSALDGIAHEFDHTVINDHEHFKTNGINPTAETLARYFHQRLESTVHPHRIHAVSVYETDDTVASYLPHER